MAEGRGRRRRSSVAIAAAAAAGLRNMEWAGRGGGIDAAWGSGCFRFGVWGLGFGVWGLVFEV